MARIAVGGLHHESNSFAPQRATFERFVEADGWPALSRGAELFARTAGINLAITGFIEAAGERHELAPLTWANAGPSGPVTRDAFERLAAMLLDDLRQALPVDAVFLDLHGAMVTEHSDDGEGELLRRLRQLVPDLPIVAALDLHANVSAAMVELADALVAYRTYPHVDLATTGARCLPLVERLLRGLPITKAHRKLDFLVPLPWQCSTIEPARELYRRVGEAEASGALSASICMGFPPSDTTAGGPSILAYAATPAAADAAADALAAAFREAERHFAGRLWGADEAVHHALAASGGKPVLLADTQDNPGGGGTSDTTGLLQALVAARAPNAALGVLADPEAAAAAHAAGAGAVLAGYALGGRLGPADVAPWRGDLEVIRLGDGRFTATGPMYRGSRIELGPMALLRPCAAPGIDILVSTRRLQAADQAIFRHLGVEPTAKAILALKSSVHFRADFEPLAGEILIVRAPGLCVADPGELPFERLPAGIRRRPATVPARSA